MQQVASLPLQEVRLAIGDPVHIRAFSVGAFKLAVLGNAVIIGLGKALQFKGKRNKHTTSVKDVKDLQGLFFLFVRLAW